MGIKYPVNHVPSFGKGSVLFERFDDAADPTGVLLHLGNCNKFEVEPKDDKAELYQSLYPTPTKIAEAVKKRDLKVSVEGTDFSPEHAEVFSIAKHLDDLAILAVAVATEDLISAVQTANAKGRFFRVASLNYDPSVAPVLTQGLAALTVDTDYTLADPVHGIIYIPTSSTLDTTGTKKVTVGYTPKAATVAQIGGHTVNFVRGHLLFVPDPADGPNITCDVWRVNLTQNGKIGLISDEYGNWTLEGSALDDTANHPDSPFYLLQYM